MQINGLIAVGLVAGFLSYLPSAWSGCHFQDAEGANTVGLNLPASITVPSDTPAQTTVWSSEWTSDSQRTLKCEPGRPAVWHVETSLLSEDSAIPGAYASGSQDFALKVAYRDRREEGHSRAFKGSWRARLNNTEGEISVQPEYRVEIITRRQLAAGAHFFQGGVMSILLNDLPVSALTINSSSMIVNSAGCNVLNDDTLVNLGRHDTIELIRRGATDYVLFSISLQCDKNVRISYLVNGKSAGNAVPGVLLLNNDVGSAQGIGVQIVDENNQPIPLNRLKFWQTTSYDGIKTMRLQSRYVRTARYITPGQANATATLSFIYR